MQAYILVNNHSRDKAIRMLCWKGSTHMCMVSCTKRFSLGDYVFCFLVYPLPICHLCKNIFQTVNLSVSFIVYTFIVRQQREKVLDKDCPSERFG